MQIKTKIVSCPTADSKPVKQEVNSTVILPPLVFPAGTNKNKASRLTRQQGQVRQSWRLRGRWAKSRDVLALTAYRCGQSLTELIFTTDR